MKLLLNAGTTSYFTRVYLEDSSSSTNAPLTGLTYASSGLKFSYIRDDQTTVTSVTPVTAAVGTYTSGGFKEIDATNFPGLYEIGIPNAALASGKTVQINVFGATNLKPCPIEIELTAVNLHSATAFVTSVPAVVDKADFALSSSQHTAIQADATNALVAQGYSSTRAGYLDNIADLDDIADVMEIESGETLRQTLRILRAVLAGNAASGGTVFKRKDGTTTALSIDHDSSGNRSNSIVGTV